MIDWTTLYVVWYWRHMNMSRATRGFMRRHAAKDWWFR